MWAFYINLNMIYSMEQNGQQMLVCVRIRKI